MRLVTVQLFQPFFYTLEKSSLVPERKGIFTDSRRGAAFAAELLSFCIVSINRRKSSPLRVLARALQKPFVHVRQTRRGGT